MKRYAILTHSFLGFSKCYPAFCMGLFLALGMSVYLSSSFLPMLFAFPFWLAVYKDKKFILFSTLMLLLGYSLSYFNHVSLKEENIEGQGYFTVDRYIPSSFNKKILCFGKIHSFTTLNGLKYKNLPVCISCSYSKRLKGNLKYLVEGKLLRKEFSYFLKKYQIKDKKKRFSLVEMRYLAKWKTKDFFSRYLTNSNSKKLVAGLVTGDFNDQFIRYSFSKLGISHVMAISGLHFSLLIALVFFLLRLFLPLQYVNYLLGILATLYFLFIGPSASIQRAWIMIMCFILSQIINKNYQPINALGFAFLVLLLIDPNIIKNLGFQLSFLSVMAILIYFPSFRSFVNKLFPIRPKETVASFSHFSRISYFLLRFIINGFSLSFCVSVIIFPVLMYHFHTFPILSLFYNLFMPLFIGIILLFSFIILLVHMVLPFLTIFLAKILDVFSSFVLHYAFFTPPFLNVQIRMKNFSFSLTIFLLFFQMIILLPWVFRKKRGSQPFEFI